MCNPNPISGWNPILVVSKDLLLGLSMRLMLAASLPSASRQLSSLFPESSRRYGHLSLPVCSAAASISRQFNLSQSRLRSIHVYPLYSVGCRQDVDGIAGDIVFGCLGWLCYDTNKSVYGDGRMVYEPAVGRIDTNAKLPMNTVFPISGISP